MPVETSSAPVVAAPIRPAAPAPPSPGFEERWAAWEARGEAQDRALRRKFNIAVPVLALLAVLFYVFMPG